MKLSDGLVLDARLAGEVMQRSIAGQVEFWARLGRTLETLLDGRRILEVSRSGAARPISECLESVDSPEGRQRVGAVLADRPFPHYEPYPDSPRLLVRTEEDGRKTIGRFVNRQFEAVNTKRKR